MDHVNPLVGPIFALALWTVIILFLGASRTIKAAKNADMSAVPKNPRQKDLEGHIPPEATWTRHNYEHLVEQPTLFYAVVLALVTMGDAIAINVWLAWGYVAFRVLHTLAQISGKSRFLGFLGSTLCLIGLITHGLIAYVSHL